MFGDSAYALRSLDDGTDFVRMDDHPVLERSDLFDALYHILMFRIQV